MEKVENFFKKLEINLLFLVILGTFIVAVSLKNVIFVMSFLAGSFLGLINFRTTKKEGIHFIKKVKKILEDSGEKANIQKESNIFIGKTFLKLFATAIVIYFLITKFKLSPIFILLGFGVIYIGLILFSLVVFLRKNKEILI